ncbi:structure-specific endonuclease subunit EME2 isoform X3 [Urocitellus parryii]|uniref:probable crossover junction endonuclease EME2 isoform X3 n=1 Tax=Urocitellus parryii TaxID=9999 RepID=UPI000E558A4B|nr:probable crossover junction endonuclease EME2 isoform X3 [Urocitellus parryii]
MAAAGPDRAGRSIWAGPALKGARRTPSHPLHPLGTQRCPERPAPQFRGGPAPPSHTHTRPNAQRPKPRIQTVLEDTGADVLMEALGALGCECRIEPQRRARSLRWSGVAPEVWATEEQELLLLLLLEPEEFLQGTAQLTQTEGPPCPVPWISPESPAHPHLAVIGLDAHLWSCQPSAQGMQQLQNSEVVQAKEVVSWPEVEEALVLLQLHADLDVLLVASWQELTQHVCAYTKALAQLPSKQCWDSQAFSFCTAGRWAAGQQVARDGSGLRGVWWRQIRQFNRVSPAVADAIVTAFPSPRLLQQALMACSTEQERLGLLADLPVEASKGRQSRRVGPDLSRRICLFLTTTSPDLLLDLGS